MEVGAAMMDASRTEYDVLVHHEDGSFWAEVPGLPGCFAAGDTMTELQDALAEALGFYLSGEQEARVEVSALEPVTDSVRAKVLVS